MQGDHSVTADTAFNSDHKVERIFVVAKLHERLVHIFMHSFKHSLASALQMNDVDVTVMVAPKESEPLVDFGEQIDTYASSCQRLAAPRFFRGKKRYMSNATGIGAHGLVIVITACPMPVAVTAAQADVAQLRHLDCQYC